MRDAGKTLIAASTSGTISGGSNRGLDAGRVLENAGSLFITSPILYFNLSGAGGGGIISNLAGAVLETQGGTSFRHNFGSPGSAVNNAGLFRKTGTGTTGFSSNSIAFNNTGTVELMAGTLQMDAGFNQSGLLLGSGSIIASFTNNGTLRPDRTPGGLTIQGNLTQGADGRVELTLGARDATLGHRSLGVSGAVTLNGTLSISLAPGFEETTSEEFSIISVGSRSGDFAFAEGITNNAGYNFETVLGGTAYALRVLVQGFVPESEPAAIESPALHLTVLADGTYELDYTSLLDDVMPELGIMSVQGDDSVHVLFDPATPTFIQYSTDLQNWHPVEGILIDQSRGILRIMPPQGTRFLFIRAER